MNDLGLLGLFVVKLVKLYVLVIEMEKNVKGIIKILILCLLISVATAIFFNDAADETLSNCVVDIVREGSANTSLLDLTVINVMDDLIMSSLHTIGNLRFISRNFSFDYYRIYNSAYIIESENLQVLHLGLSQVVNNRQWNPKARYIIILHNLEDPDVLNLTKFFFDHNMDDVFSIVHKNNNFTIYNFNTTSNTFCRRSYKWVFVSYCSKPMTIKLKLPVLRKQESIRNCQFRFITYNMWPFINFDSTNREGIEQRILKEFEKYEKVKIELYTVTDKTDANGVVMPVSIESMLKSVHDNEFEGAVGGFVTTTNTEFLSYTYPFITDHAIFLLAHAENLHPWAFVIINTGLSFTVFLVFIIFCVVTNLLNVFPTQGRDVSRDILLVLGYILNKIGVKNIHPNLPQKLLFFNLLWFALVLPYVIHGQIYSSITKPNRGYEPKEVNELKDYTFILYSKFAFATPWVKQCDSILNCLLEVMNDKTKSLYTRVSKAFVLAHSSKIIDDQCKKKVYKLGEVTIEFRTMFLRRGSFLLDPLNKFMLRMVSSGIINKYSNEILHLENLKCQYRHSPTMAININSMYVLYIILLVGYMISFIIFILELILGAKKAC